jgi:signal transduction histidine kinase
VFTAALFITAYMINPIMRRLREGFEEQARARAAVEQLMRERTEFMLEVAHNMRAPLGASLSMLELLDDRYLGELNERQREYLERIGARLRSQHQLIGELLTIGRARDWSREIPDVVVDMSELAETTRRTFEDEARSESVDLRVDCEPGIPRVDSGADLLERLLENLVSNAIKYTPEGGTVEVRFERRGEDEVRIIVRDTGIGIPAEEQDKLFREFFRAANARKHTREGTGLGLALVKQIVERHRGRIDLSSEEGRGTEIVIDLPTHRDARRPG